MARGKKKRLTLTFGLASCEAPVLVSGVTVGQLMNPNSLYVFTKA